MNIRGFYPVFDYADKDKSVVTKGELVDGGSLAMQFIGHEVDEGLIAIHPQLIDGKTHTVESVVEIVRQELEALLKRRAAQKLNLRAGDRALPSSN